MIASLPPPTPPTVISLETTAGGYSATRGGSSDNAQFETWKGVRFRLAVRAEITKGWVVGFAGGYSYQSYSYLPAYPATAHEGQFGVFLGVHGKLTKDVAHELRLGPDNSFLQALRTPNGYARARPKTYGVGLELGYLVVVQVVDSVALVVQGYVRPSLWSEWPAIEAGGMVGARFGLL